MTNVMNCVLLLKLKAVLNIICLPVFGITRKYKKTERSENSMTYLIVLLAYPIPLLVLFWFLRRQSKIV